MGSSCSLLICAVVVVVSLLTWQLARVRYIINIGGYRHWVLYDRGDVVRLSDGFHTYRVALKNGGEVDGATLPGITPTMLVTLQSGPLGTG